MTAFPVVQSLEIESYQLIPGSTKKPTKILFQPGPNAIVGVNSSGKTTLLSIALRCLTGPYNLPSSSSSSELGQIRPRAVPMRRRQRQLFADRVGDAAEKANATLIVAFGKHVVEIKRQLADLSLVSLVIDGQKIGLSRRGSDSQDEDARYQQEIATLLGVATFFDVLVVLHFLVFFQEDRRALVWDSNAQRQIFRVLLLPSASATEYALAQQNLISVDSAVRNTRSLITRHKDETRGTKKKSRAIAQAEAQRRILVAEAEALRSQLDAVITDRSTADEDRYRARRERLRAAEIRESLSRDLENLKMVMLQDQLGSSSETVRYIVGHLLSDGQCLVCGTEPSPAARKIDAWVKDGRCPICGSHHEVSLRRQKLSEVDKRRIPRLESQLQLAETQIRVADAAIREAQGRFDKAGVTLEGLERRRVTLDVKLIAVVKKIPAQRAAGGEVSDISALRRILANEQRRLKAAERRFRKVSKESVVKVQRIQKAIASEFRKYVNLFVREDAALVYKTVSERVGQGGGFFDFPSFRLAMSGGAVAGQTVRERPDEVSESQTEFIDLAFRMALMVVSGNGGPATLVVDAPEGALDFVFAERAGKQLAAFSTAHPQNRVIITSYLPSDHFLRMFLAKSKDEKARRERVVDLISLSAPNAATRDDRERYETFLGMVMRGEAASRA